MSDEIRILILEDVPADAELAERELRRAGVVFRSKRVDTKDAFARGLEDFKPDVILVDYKLPAYDGRSAVQLVRQKHPQVPAIMVTGTLGDEAAVELLKAGARDYVLKDGLARLGPAVRRALSEEEGIRARKQAERAVRDSERRFRSLIEHASDLVAVVDAQGKITYISPAVQRLGGYEVDEILGTNYLDYAHPEDRPAAAAGLAELLRNPAKPHASEFRFRAKDGAWVTLESIARNALDDPAINGLVINSRDITERKQDEHRRRLEAERLAVSLALSNMVDANEQAVLDFILEECLRITESRYSFIGWINDDKSAMTIHAWSKDAMARCAVENMPRVFPLAEAGLWAEPIRQNRAVIINDCARPHEHRRGLPAGHVEIKRYLGVPIFEKGRIVLIAAVANKESEYMQLDADSLTSVVTDAWRVIQRNQAERDRRLLAEAFQQTAEAIMVATADARFLYVNTAFERLFGYLSKEILGQSLVILSVPGADAGTQPAATARAVLETGNFSGEVLRRAKDGTAIPVYVTVSAVRGHDGKIESIVGVITDLREIKRAEAVLRESEHAYRTLAENLPGIVYRVFVREGHRMQFFNRVAAEVTGYVPEELAAGEVCSIEPLILEEDRAGVVTEVKRAMVENRQFVVEYRLRHKDGGIRWLLERGTPVPGPDGAPLYIDGVILDVTERKQAEVQLKLFRDLLDQSSDSVFVVDPASSRFLDVNEAACRSLGYTRAELLQRGVVDIQTALRDIAAWQAHAGQLRANGQALVEFTARRKDGSEFPVEVSLRHVASGDRAYIIAVVRDVTERKQAEATLRESEERYRQIIQTSMDGFWIVDARGRILEVNAAYCQLSGYTREELPNMSVPDVEAKEAPEETARHIREIMTEGHARFETRHRRKDGQLLDLEVSTVHQTALGGGRFFVFLHDISERKRAEEALKHSNRALRALSACNEKLIHAESEPKLLQDLCRLIVETGDFRFAWIGYVEHDAAKGVRPVAHFGVDEGYVESLRITWADTERGRGPTGRAVRSGRPEFARDMRTDPQFAPWREQALQHGFASSIVLPLKKNGEVFGTFSIYAAEPDAFDEDEVKLLAELADDLAFGIVTLRTRSDRDRLQQEQLRSAERLESALIGTIQAVALTVEKRDPYTAGHQQRVAQLCLAIGREIGLDEEHTKGMRLGALIHDIGKIYVPAEILNRPGKLTSPEFEIIKSHPRVGHDIIKDVRFPWPVADIVLQHHERLDGSGYPQGLKAGQIILEAKILAVADVVEAMASHRPYRPALGIESALHEIERGRGSAYDPVTADACLKLFHEGTFAFQA